MRSEFDIKSNTCSSIPFTDSIDHPNISIIINSISKLLSTTINEEVKLDNQISISSDLYIFSEDKYITDFPHVFDHAKLLIFQKHPSQIDIAYFLKGLYLAIDFSPECFIISLVYLNRFIAITNCPFLPTNWRPLVLISIIIANKVWDELNFMNYEISNVYPFFEKYQIDQMETRFLQIINYNVKVSLSSYSSYFMELKTLNPFFNNKNMMNSQKFNALKEKQKKFVNNLKKKSRTYV